MYGVVTRNDEETRWPEFDRAFYEVKDVTGRSAEPVESAVSMVSCFGDNAAAEENPDLVPVTPEGQPATRERTHFDWAYVCPTHEEYRAGLLEIIEDCAAVTPDVRLDDVGFPRPEYCYCERCNERYADWVERRHTAGEGPPPADTGPEDRREWRASVITEFLEAAEALVDEFVVPLYDTHYGTTYWLETIASGFRDRLETPVSVELYAVNVDIDDLIHAAEVAGEYGESVLFGYEASNARAALRRMGADEGVEW